MQFLVDQNENKRKQKEQQTDSGKNLPEFHDQGRDFIRHVFLILTVRNEFTNLFGDNKACFLENPALFQKQDEFLGLPGIFYPHQQQPVPVQCQVSIIIAKSISIPFFVGIEMGTVFKLKALLEQSFPGDFYRVL